MNPAIDFIYNLSNVTLFQPSLTIGIVGVILTILVAILVYFVYLYGYGAVIIYEEERLHEHKKSVLQELIVMKDIQTEIEKEIERAMLNETFSG